jgi:predicted AAA+ superfamily ATPase
MVLKSDIEKALKMQLQILKMEYKLSVREELATVNRGESHILVVSGIRRSGKSSLLRLLMNETKGKFLFLNFEDSRIFQFQLSDFNKLEEIAALFFVCFD